MTIKDDYKPVIHAEAKSIYDLEQDINQIKNIIIDMEKSLNYLRQTSNVRMHGIGETNHD